jgi:hypothetical protein
MPPAVSCSGSTSQSDILKMDSRMAWQKDSIFSCGEKGITPRNPCRSSSARSSFPWQKAFQNSLELTELKISFPEDTRGVMQLSV